MCKETAMRRLVVAAVLVLAAVVTACGRLSGEREKAQRPEPTRKELTNLARHPPDIRDSWAHILAVIDGRVSAWEGEVNASAMTTRELHDGIEMIFDAIHSRSEEGDQMLVLRELFARAEALCGYLPAGHPFIGEYSPD
jgi:hypothetical protein